MPTTPEASALAEEVFYMDTPEEVAEALDRFAAERVDELLKSLSYTADAIKTVEAALKEQGAPPQTSGDPEPLQEPREISRRGESIISAIKIARETQTGGGDAPVDMSIEAAKARLSTYQPLGSHAKGVAGPAIAPDELTERDGADPMQTGGGDAPLVMPELEPACVITIALHWDEAERATEIYDATEALLGRMGEIGLLSMTCPRTSRGGGDAGELARAAMSEADAERLLRIRRQAGNDPEGDKMFLLRLHEAALAMLREELRRLVKKRQSR